MSRSVVMAGWDDVPHLDAAEKARLLQSTPPHLRDARSKGIPVLGSGAIYPISVDDIEIPDFQLPVHWPKAYGLDVGWRATAAVWGAWDRDADCVYLWAEYKRGQAEPAVHASAIKARGAELRGAIDPASRGRSQKDGEQLLYLYSENGLQLTNAENAVEAGLFAVYERFTTGRLRIFKSLVQTLSELRMYRRDERGNVVKENDHLMDAMRYLVMTMNAVMEWTVPQDLDEFGRKRRSGGSWMAS